MSLGDRLKALWRGGSPAPAADGDGGAGEAYRKAGNADLAAGRLAEALAQYEAWAVLQPSRAEAHLNRGFVLHRLGRLADASAALRQSAALDPASHEARHFLGQVRAAMGDLVDAETQFTEATRLSPGFAHAWLALGEVRFLRGAYGSARQAFESAAGADPEMVAAWRGICLAAAAAGVDAEAVPAAERWVALEPANPHAHGMLSDLLSAAGRPGEALLATQAGLALDGANSSLLRQQVGLLAKLQGPEAALEPLRRLRSLDASNADVAADVGAALLSVGHPEEALPLLASASSDGRNAIVAHNHAVCLMKLRRFDEAITVLEAALSAAPENRVLRFDLAIARLTLGQFEAAWPHWEARDSVRPPRFLKGVPRWTADQSAAGRRVLLLPEQGLGDNIHFARYLPEVQAAGAEVMVQLPPRLRPLFADQWPGVTFIGEGDRIERPDLWAPIMSLPGLLHRPQPMTPAAPYVTADASRRDHWRAVLPPVKQPTVGLVWAGNPKFEEDRRRSVPLATVARHARLLPARWVAVQYEVPEADRAVLADWPELVLTGSQQRDMADAAALLEQLDALVCVDTSIAHLGGALGRPTFLLLSDVPDWRWGLDGSTTPWYPTVTLVRQRQSGQWDEAVQEALAAALQLRDR